MISIAKSNSKKNQSSREHKKSKSPHNEKKHQEEQCEPKKEHQQEETKTDCETKKDCQQEETKCQQQECKPKSSCDDDWCNRPITYGDWINAANMVKNITLSNNPPFSAQNFYMFQLLLLQMGANHGRGVTKKYNAHLVNLPGFKGNYAVCDYTFEGLKLCECNMVFAGLPPNEDWNIQIANDCDYISPITFSSIFPDAAPPFNNQVTLQLLHVPFQSVSTLLPEFDINEVCVNVNKGDDSPCPFPATTSAPYVKDAIVGTITGNVLTISANSVNAILYTPTNPEDNPPTPQGHTTGVTFLYLKRH